MKPKKNYLKFTIPLLILSVILLVIALGSEDDASGKITDTSLSLDERVESAVITAHGTENNMGEKRIISITNDYNVYTIKLKANKNAITSTIITNLNTHTVDLLEQLHKIEDLKRYSILWQDDFVDGNGNKLVDTILLTSFQRDDVAKVNFDNKAMVDVKTVAYTYELHKSIE